jgi:hypothetical protein
VIKIKGEKDKAHKEVGYLDLGERKHPTHQKEVWEPARPGLLLLIFFMKWVDHALFVFFL